MVLLPLSPVIFIIKVHQVDSGRLGEIVLHRLQFSDPAFSLWLMATSTWRFSPNSSCICWR